MQKTHKERLEALFEECDQVSESAQQVLRDNKEFCTKLDIELAHDWWMRFLFWAQWRPLFPTLH